MTKVMIDVPDNLHRLVKTIATSQGETMKHFVLRAMENLAKQEAKIKNDNSIHELIGEDEADNFLKPYLSTLVAKITNGEEKVMSSESFFKELAKS
jgi:hypothetical protein